MKRTFIALFLVTALWGGLGCGGGGGPTFFITTGGTLAVATVGTPYGPVTLVATGGTGTLTWTIIVGALPNGLNLSIGGVISGTPTTTGNFNATVRATDSSIPPQTADKNFTLASSFGVTVTPTTLPNGTVGQNYNQTLSVTGAAGPYTWAITSGRQPYDVAFCSQSTSSSCVFQGTVLDDGTANFTVRVTAANGAYRDVAYTVTVPAPVAGAFSPSTSQNLGPAEYYYSSVTIPAGVTVTLTGDVILHSTGPITVDGTLTGDCFNLQLLGADNVTLNGTVKNSCTTDPGINVDPPDLKIVGDGVVTEDSNAVIESDGDIYLSNNPNLTPLLTPSGLGGGTGPANHRTIQYNYVVGGTHRMRARSGCNSSPTSEGISPPVYRLLIYGNVRFLPSADIIAADGVPGCDKTGSGTVQGGRGRRGSSILVEAHGDAFDLTNPGHIGICGSFASGSGGRGGNATSNGNSPVAEGGLGAGPGAIRFRADAGIEIAPNCFLTPTLTLGDGGNGGNATATGNPGTDQCPFGSNGEDATGTGGLGASVAAVFTASPGVPTSVDLDGGNAGNGGTALATSGHGGDALGCVGFGAGGDAGNATATGGAGGSASVTPNGATVVGGFDGGNGGNADAVGERGGNAVVAGNPNATAAGGRAGDARSTGGFGGSDRNGVPQPGGTGHSDGGKGGDATATGAAGPPCGPGGDGTATAGRGGDATAFGNQLNGGSFQHAGNGGAATATGGKGGDCPNCPAGAGGPGGMATATGGNGGNANGAANGGGTLDRTPGDGGKGDATGGLGGNGADCDKFNKGGDGGNGGDATSNAGTAGTPGGTPGGNATKGGDGGPGGNGCPEGTGGPKGTGTGIPNDIPDGVKGLDGTNICFLWIFQWPYWSYIPTFDGNPPTWTYTLPIFDAPNDDPTNSRQIGTLPGKFQNPTEFGSPVSYQKTTDGWVYLKPGAIELDLTGTTTYSVIVKQRDLSADPGTGHNILVGYSGGNPVATASNFGAAAESELTVSYTQPLDKVVFTCTEICRFWHWWTYLIHDPVVEKPSRVQITVSPTARAGDTIPIEIVTLNLSGQPTYFRFFDVFADVSGVRSGTFTDRIPLTDNGNGTYSGNVTLNASGTYNISAFMHDRSTLQKSPLTDTKTTQVIPTEIVRMDLTGSNQFGPMKILMRDGPYDPVPRPPASEIQCTSDNPNLSPGPLFPATGDNFIWLANLLAQAYETAMFTCTHTPTGATGNVNVGYPPWRLHFKDPLGNDGQGFLPGSPFDAIFQIRVPQGYPEGWADALAQLKYPKDSGLLFQGCQPLLPSITVNCSQRPDPNDPNFILVDAQVMNSTPFGGECDAFKAVFTTPPVSPLVESYIGVSDFLLFTTTAEIPYDPFIFSDNSWHHFNFAIKPTKTINMHIYLVAGAGTQAEAQADVDAAIAAFNANALSCNCGFYINIVPTFTTIPAADWKKIDTDGDGWDRYDRNGDGDYADPGDNNDAFNAMNLGYFDVSANTENVYYVPKIRGGALGVTYWPNGQVAVDNSKDGDNLTLFHEKVHELDLRKDGDFDVNDSPHDPTNAQGAKDPKNGMNYDDTGTNLTKTQCDELDP